MHCTFGNELEKKEVGDELLFMELLNYTWEVEIPSLMYFLLCNARY